MLCAFVRNCVIPPTIICIINCFASSVGFEQAHLLRVSFTLSMVADQGWAASILFPIHPPRTCVRFLSVVIVMPGGRLLLSECIHQVWAILCWCFSVSMDIISVFSRLNLAPNTLHHFVRRISRLAYSIYLCLPSIWWYCLHIALF